MDPTRVPTQDPTADRMTVTVADAAKLLGLSTEAVRMRVKRGTLASTRVAGTVYVLIDQPNDEPNGRPNDQPNGQPNAQPNVDPTPLVESLREHNADLRDQVEHLRQELEVRNEELRRKDHLLARTLERIPEIEPPPEPREGREKASENGGKGDGNPEQERRSWWRRWFTHTR